MIQATPTTRDLLRFNRQLPDALRQSSVVVRFAAPIPSRRLVEFHAIHLTPPMLAGGEGDFWRPEVNQKHRLGRQVCLSCRGDLWRMNSTDYRCLNPGCRQANGRPTSELVQGIAPHRGVVRCEDSFSATYQGKPASVSFIVGRETVTLAGGVRISDPLVNGCLLVLDRRYSDDVLCAVGRTANEVCQIMEWGVL